jgi:hypothetical protein
MRTSPRLWIWGLLIGAVLTTQSGGVVAAQIPTPIETTPVDTIGGAVEDVTGTVNDTIDQATDPVDTVTGGGGRVPQPVETVIDAVTDTTKDAGGVANDTTGGTTGNATNDATTAVGGVTQQANDSGSAGAASTEGTSATGTGTYRSYTSAVTGGGLQNWAKSRGLFNLTSFLGTSQPSLAILVDAVNDADGDGIFSDTENAPEPGVDVSFKALITNIGSTNFEIAGVSNSYAADSGPAQEKVCAELVGIMLAPGESLACSFPVPDIAPARGESLVNTVVAAGFEVGKGARRGASDSDSTTVETVVPGDEVLAVAIKRNLAFTGTHAARLVAVGLFLLAMGGALLSLARARSRRLTRPLPSESSSAFLEWWTLRPAKRGMKEKSHQR